MPAIKEKSKIKPVRKTVKKTMQPDSLSNIEKALLSLKMIEIEQEKYIVKQRKYQTGKPNLYLWNLTGSKYGSSVFQTESSNILWVDFRAHPEHDLRKFYLIYDLDQGLGAWTVQKSE